MAQQQQSWTHPYRLYVVEFDDGVVKAGISAQPNGRRIKGLAKSYGPIRQHFTSDLVGGFAVEWQMLQNLCARAKCVKGREWFTGISFTDAVEIAKDAARSFESSNPPVCPLTHGRKARTLLSFNDAEIDVVKRYAAYTGKPVAQAIRELLLSDLVDVLHGGNSLAAH